MVYKKFIKRNGKDVGPYYYTSVREKDGRVRTIYLGNVSHGEALRKESLIFRKLKVNPVHANNVSINKNAKGKSQNPLSFKIFAFIVLAIALSLFISADGVNVITGLFVSDWDNGLEGSYNIENDVKLSDSVVYEVNVRGLSRVGRLSVKEVKIEGYGKVVVVQHNLVYEEGYFLDVGYGALYRCYNFDLKMKECVESWIYVKNIAGLYRGELENGAYAVKEALF